MRASAAGGVREEGGHAGRGGDQLGQALLAFYIAISARRIVRTELERNRDSLRTGGRSPGITGSVLASGRVPPNIRTPSPGRCAPRSGNARALHHDERHLSASGVGSSRCRRWSPARPLPSDPPSKLTVRSRRAILGPRETGEASVAGARTALRRRLGWSPRPATTRYDTQPAGGHWHACGRCCKFKSRFDRSACDQPFTGRRRRSVELRSAHDSNPSVLQRRDLRGRSVLHRSLRLPDEGGLFLVAVRRRQQALQGASASTPLASEDALQRLAGYEGQYVGVVEGGKRSVLSNYFCNGAVEQVKYDLAAEWVTVNDGERVLLQLLVRPTRPVVPRHRDQRPRVTPGHAAAREGALPRNQGGAGLVNGTVPPQR